MVRMVMTPEQRIRVEEVLIETLNPDQLAIEGIVKTLSEQPTEEIPVEEIRSELEKKHPII